VESGRGQGDLVGRLPSQSSGHVPSRDISIGLGDLSHDEVCYASVPVVFETTDSGRRQQALDNADTRPPSPPSPLRFRLQSLQYEVHDRLDHISPVEAVTADAAESVGAAAELAAERTIVTSPAARTEDEPVEYIER
jgi:hypothetical protein